MDTAEPLAGERPRAEVTREVIIDMVYEVISQVIADGELTVEAETKIAALNSRLCAALDIPVTDQL